MKNFCVFNFQCLTKQQNFITIEIFASYGICSSAVSFYITTNSTAII